MASNTPTRPSVTSRALSVLGTFDVAHTRRTLTEIAAAAEVRQRGYATTSEEMTIGASSIAAPITNRAAEVIAALGLVTSSHRRDLGRLAPAVQLAARGITRTINPSI
jgi:DNA-binding IclR family transcriptional regulator